MSICGTQQGATTRKMTERKTGFQIALGEEPELMGAYDLAARLPRFVYGHLTGGGATS